VRYLFLTILFIGTVFAGVISSDDEYKIIKTDKYSIIYTNDNLESAKFFSKNLDKFLEFNNKSFGFSFDEPMQIILVSNKNQVANAFSTQFPFNLGAYYNGGGGANEYFSIDSWIKTLFIHEIVHNYQMNAKNNSVSKNLHKYLGNNVMPLWIPFIPIPLFTVPNTTLPTPFIEGNAVLNESVYLNGGRLHSGYQNALKNIIILDNKLDITRFINNHKEFPYGTEKYIIGGYFMEYLARIYGLDKVNQFFYKHSSKFINPFRVNDSFVKHFGKRYIELFSDFVNETKKRYKNFQRVKGKLLASSKQEIYLNKKGNEIFFVTSDLVKEKQLHIYNIFNSSMKSTASTLGNNKVFKIDNKYYSRGNYFINDSEMKFGLFDDKLHLKEDTLGLDIKDIYNEKKAYIKIKESFISSKLYVNNEFINDVSSDAIFDANGNIYYFKQLKNGSKHKRALFKNKEKIFEYDGYYGKVVEIDNHDIYFIANSKNGTTLYKYNGENIIRLHVADNIIDAKIVKDDKMLFVTIESSGYYLYESKIHPIDTDVNIPLSNVVALSNNFSFDENYKDIKLQADDYNSFTQMKYVNLYPYYTYQQDGDDLYGLTFNFADPLIFNILSLYAYKFDDGEYIGASYLYDKGLFPFRFNIYKYDKENIKEDERELGGSIELSYNILKKGRNSLDVGIKNYMDNENKHKNPILFNLSHNYRQSYPLALGFENKSKSIGIIKEDRGDLQYRLNHSLQKHLLSEIYFNATLDYIKSNNTNFSDDRGIKASDNIFEVQKDETSLNIPSSDYDFFIDESKSLSLGFEKTLNLSKYFYSFPLSVVNEKIYYTYNYYDINGQVDEQFNENIFGLQLNMLFMHNNRFPVDIKYIKSDFNYGSNKLLFSLGVVF
jgi:hypothetical protein